MPGLTYSVRSCRATPPNSTSALMAHGTQQGFALAIFLVYQGAWAIFGVCGDSTHGHEPTSPWLVEGLPALVNEQVAIATALLWVAQTMTYPATRAWHYTTIARLPALRPGEPHHPCRRSCLLSVGCTIS